MLPLEKTGSPYKDPRKECNSPWPIMREIYHRAETLAELSRLTGIDRRYLYRWFYQQHPPRLRDVVKLASAVGLELQWVEKATQSPASFEHRTRTRTSSNSIPRSPRS